MKRPSDPKIPAAEASIERTRRYHGRRRGKPLRPGQRDLLATRLPQLALDLSRPAPARLQDLFPVTVTEIRLEIGCGGGEYLVHNAGLAPHIGFIGAELYQNALAKMIAAIDHSGCSNVRIFDAEAEDLLDWLPAGSVAVIDMLYPDPWPKRRHWKRRFVNHDNLDRIARVLVPSGLFRFVTDWAGYADWSLAAVWDHGALEWTAQSAQDWRSPWPDWPGTRYEAKALAQGRRPIYLTFAKPD